MWYDKHYTELINLPCDIISGKIYTIKNKTGLWNVTRNEILMWHMDTVG